MEKKRFLLLLVIIPFLFGQQAYSQLVIPTLTNVEPFTKVDQLPEFRGGDQALYQYIANNFNYPQRAMDAGVQGIVKIGFVVQPDGSITNVSVLSSLNPDCDAESVRLISSMPRWIPGILKGQVVPVRQNLSIAFEMLPKEQKPDYVVVKSPADADYRAGNKVLIVINGQEVSEIRSIQAYQIQSVSVVNVRDGYSYDNQRFIDRAKELGRESVLFIELKR